VDGEWRYIPDLPVVTDEMGCVCNLLDVHVSIFMWLLVLQIQKHLIVQIFISDNDF
jgi:hypothetical protein